jgi:hypothetical protein
MVYGRDTLDLIIVYFISLWLLNSQAGIPAPTRNLNKDNQRKLPIKQPITPLPVQIIEGKLVSDEVQLPAFRRTDYSQP